MEGENTGSEQQPRQRKSSGEVVDLFYMAKVSIHHCFLVVKIKQKQTIFVILDWSNEGQWAHQAGWRCSVFRSVFDGCYAGKAGTQSSTCWLENRLKISTLKLLVKAQPEKTSYTTMCYPVCLLGAQISILPEHDAEIGPQIHQNVWMCA